LPLEAFDVTSHYDTAIFKYFNGEQTSETFKLSVSGAAQLRYGENPHQRGFFHGNLNEIFTQLHGKEVSYNNLLDIDAAVNLISEFREPTVAILKHNNACGLASRDTLLNAWVDALAGDPVSAFGGVIITNTPIDEDTAKEMDKLFFEVLIAPSFTEEALTILKSKKNRILLKLNKFNLDHKQHRSILEWRFSSGQRLKN
jgi:phosphoribosylaminoimidazolecarboxamide formyltransferase / IMP cyclohydrolase